MDPFREAFASLMLAIIAAFLGRLAKHALQVQRGIRKFWGVPLLLELPVAIFMGFVGDGISDWMDLSQRASIGMIAALSYLGPAVVERVLVSKLTKDGLK